MSNKVLQDAFDQDDILVIAREFLRECHTAISNGGFKGVKPSDLVSFMVLYKDILQARGSGLSDKDSDLEEWFKGKEDDE